VELAALSLFDTVAIVTRGDGNVKLFLRLIAEKSCGPRSDPSLIHDRPLEDCAGQRGFPGGRWALGARGDETQGGQHRRLLGSGRQQEGAGLAADILIAGDLTAAKPASFVWLAEQLPKPRLGATRAVNLCY